MRVTKERSFAGTGRHMATFDGVIEDPDGGFGRPCLRWRFTTDGGEQIQRTTGTICAAGTTAGEMLDAIAGREVKIDDEFDLATQFGQRYEIKLVRVGDVSKFGSIRVVESDAR